MTLKDHEKNAEAVVNSASPLYGKGIFCRSIRLQKQERQGDNDCCVVAEVEDDNHAFRVRLFHDSEKVTGVESDAIRFPLTTCPDASNVMDQLIGLPLTVNPREFSGSLNVKQFCTHQFDLACLAQSHALQAKIVRQYDIIVADPKTNDEGVSCNHVEASVDGQLILSWQLENLVIKTPGPWSGVGLAQGFSGWAAEHLEGDELACALVVMRSIFVSNSRRFNFDDVADMDVVVWPFLKDVCYSYREPIVSEAKYTAGTVRDFTFAKEKILKFENFNGREYYDE